MENGRLGRRAADDFLAPSIAHLFTIYAALRSQSYSSPKGGGVLIIYPLFIDQATGHVKTVETNVMPSRITYS